MWDMAANDDVRQQHLLSQMNSLERKLPAIQASHATGTGHTLATLSRVQDTWGTPWSGRERLGWMGAPCPSARRLDSQRQQQQASQVKERLQHSPSICEPL